MDMEACIHTAAEVIRSRSSLQPQVGLILGSGLGDFCDGLQNAVKIPFSELPAFPQATVEGHYGEFWIGTHQEVPVLALRGRLHYYEGYPPECTYHPCSCDGASGNQNTDFDQCRRRYPSQTFPGIADAAAGPHQPVRFQSFDRQQSWGIRPPLSGYVRSI